MQLLNPYTHGVIDYPIDLSNNNIIIDYYIAHDTPFCNWYSEWLVVQLYSGDMIYIPYGYKNNRNVYVVTALYLQKELKKPYGIYTTNIINIAKMHNINDILNNEKVKQ